MLKIWICFSRTTAQLGRGKDVSVWNTCCGKDVPISDKKWQFFLATNTRFIYINSQWCQTKWTQSLSRGHLFGVPSSSWHDTHAHLNLSVVCRHINREDFTLTTGLDSTREVNWLPSSLQSKTMTGILCKTVTIDIARQRSLKKYLWMSFFCGLQCHCERGCC